MSPEEIKALRNELGCTARDLAAALGIELPMVQAWERAEQFPTKRHCDAMDVLRQKGAAAMPKKRRKGTPATPMQALADPDLWRLVRKLIAHPDLRAEAMNLAAKYADPAEEPAE